MADPAGDTLQRIRELLDRFQTAHRAGMEALSAGDIDGFGKAIAIEREIIEAQERLIEEMRGSSKKSNREAMPTASTTPRPPG